MNNQQKQLLIFDPSPAYVGKPCRLFALGKCAKGNACKFSHVQKPPQKQSSTLILVQNTGKGAQASRVQVTIAKKVKTTASANGDLSKAAYFVVDASGSMRGDKATAAADGLLQVKKTVLTDRDFMSLYTFSEDTTSQFQHKKSKTVKDQAVNNLIKQATEKGTETALYDAVALAIKDIPKDVKYRDQIKFVVVLTDGQDNKSRTTFEECKTLITKPGLANFYFILIGVGLLSNTKETMKSMCEARHAHYVDSGASKGQIKAAFATVGSKMQAQYAEFVLRVSKTGHLGSDAAFQAACDMVAQGQMQAAQTLVAPARQTIAKPRLLLIK